MKRSLVYAVLSVLAQVATAQTSTILRQPATLQLSADATKRAAGPVVWKKGARAYAIAVRARGTPVKQVNVIDASTGQLLASFSGDDLQ